MPVASAAADLEVLVLPEPPSAGRRASTPSAGLSDEELELVRLLATELPSGAIARRLHISERTLRRRVNALCERLGVSGRIEAAVWAARRGLV